MLSPTIVQPAQMSEVIKIIAENALTVLTASFSAVFIMIIAVFFFNALRKLDLTTLFLSEGDSKKVSSTRFWSSIAYFAATIAFLAINLLAPVGASIELVWGIYLTVIAGSTVMSKFLSLKYGGEKGDKPPE